ncbi:AAA family ATPase [Paraburkholderia phenazinium]|uniref:AAA family ATPase n=1 Tax=Paraburkholderia phenazinium TaxID=60549 RepID=UPI00158B4F6E|nr:ATP-binding protein [Paraburkholderia phenazinium]
MRMLTVRIRNYKCFVDTGDIALAPGFNIFIGRNDAGKSALIEALSLRHAHNPHRSLESVPTPTSEPSPAAPTTVTYELSAEELRDHLSRVNLVYLATTANGATDAFSTFRQLVETGDGFEATWTNNTVVRSDLLGMASVPRTPGRFAKISNQNYPNGLNLQFDSDIQAVTNDYGVGLSNYLRDRSYAFRAERLVLGRCSAAPGKILNPGAQNLAAVLNVLSSSNPSRYERLMGHVRTIFPHITGITSVVIEANQVEARVWSVPLESERSDLAVPLNESGTGIGQVLAMLYVVVTSDLPSVIMIDEPQSFLHPGAVRKLFEILRLYGQHQYVVTTHSPGLIALTESDRLFSVRRTGAANVSNVMPIDGNRQQDLRMSLADVGVRLGDVFGADSILWVEGKTEETCFPELLRGLTQTRLQGVQILGVVSTDELGAKNATRVFDIYSRLAGTASLLPPAVAFILDKEQRSEREIADIERMSGGLARWLPLRMYENYLLEPACIAHLINAEDFERPNPLAAGDIQVWMEHRGGERKYFAPEEPAAYLTAGWQQRVHGAKLLDDIFNEFTEARVCYDKVKHGVLLTQKLIEQPTEALMSFCEALSEIVRNAPESAQ